MSEAIEYYRNKEPRGEYVLVVQGKSREEKRKEEEEVWRKLTIEEHIKKYMNEGISKKDAIKKVAKDRNIAKSEVYKYSLKL